MIAPARGALKIEAIPAPSPAASAICLDFLSSLRVDAMKLPAPAPICAIGPSLPDVPPEPIVRAEAKSFTIGTLGRILASSLWNARMAASVPTPSASGAKRDTTSPESNPPRVVTTGIRYGTPNDSGVVYPPSPPAVGGEY